MSLLPRTTVGRVALATGVVAGGMLAHELYRYHRDGGSVSQGGTPPGALAGPSMGFRHVTGFALRNLHRPQALRIAYEGERLARATEHERYHGGAKTAGYDDGPDAFRHTYGAALISYRLIIDAGMSPAAAAGFTNKAGLAHERDSRLQEPHRSNSRAMDLHNNQLGIAIGLEAIKGVRRLHDPDRELAAAVEDAIRGGRAVVLDAPTLPPRPSRPADIDAPSANVLR